MVWRAAISKLHECVLGLLGLDLILGRLRALGRNIISIPVSESPYLPISVALPQFKLGNV